MLATSSSIEPVPPVPRPLPPDVVVVVEPSPLPPDEVVDVVVDCPADVDVDEDEVDDVVVSSPVDVDVDDDPVTSVDDVEVDDDEEDDDEEEEDDEVDAAVSPPSSSPRSPGRATARTRPTTNTSTANPPRIDKRGFTVGDSPRFG